MHICLSLSLKWYAIFIFLKFEKRNVWRNDCWSFMLFCNKVVCIFLKFILTMVQKGSEGICLSVVWALIASEQSNTYFLSMYSKKGKTRWMFVRLSLDMYTNQTPFTKLPCLHNDECSGPIDICACTLSIYLYKGTSCIWSESLTFLTPFMQRFNKTRNLFIHKIFEK